jgi:hypothetical protein
MRRSRSSEPQQRQAAGSDHGERRSCPECDAGAEAIPEHAEYD